MITIACPHCDAKLKIRDELKGKRVRCTHCQSAVEVPAGNIAPAARQGPPVPRSVAEDATLPPVQQADDCATAGCDGPWFAGAEGPKSETPAAIIQAGTSYQVADEIARGGMGAIMRAVDQDIEREVAVKFLLNQADSRQKARFVEEAKITGQLEHPNIVPIHQLGVNADGRCFFSMKMVKGKTLAQILDDQRAVGQAASLSKREGTPEGRDAARPTEVTLGRLLTVFSNICNALAYAHARNVIHRDLKPANVMVGDFGEVYVMDWGLAKVLSPLSPVLGGEGSRERGTDAPARSTAQKKEKKGTDTQPAKPPDKVVSGRSSDSDLTQDGAIMGTPAYMPPEQAKGDTAAIDQRSDIYSLGAILYEILTLTPPVGRGGDALAILMRVVEGQIEPPEKRASARHIPPELSAIAMKALSMAPADRYQTVEELQGDIHLFQEGRSVSAKQDSAWEIFKKLVKRNKGASSATAAALVVLAVVVGYFLKINYDARVLAESERNKANENYASYVEEQKLRKQQGLASIPSFLTAARLLVNQRDFDGARAQVRVVLEFDPEQLEARFLQGQLLLIAQEFDKARADLEAYGKHRPNDPLAKDLLALLPRAKADDIATQVLLAEIFSRRQAYALADGALQSLGENAVAAREKLLALFQERLDMAWPGKGRMLTFHKDGAFQLSLSGFKELTDLSPLRGLPLTSLNLTYCVQVRDLAPLNGMPLTSLDVSHCAQVRDLEPLRGMPLSSLNLYKCAQVRDLAPLKGMPLISLSLDNCGQVRELAPLKGMPLTSLRLVSCSQVQDLESLKGLPLTSLDLSYCTQLRDLAPLTGTPLASLNLHRCGQLQDLAPLKGLPLKSLDIGITAISDLTPLQEMNLEHIAITPGRITQGMDMLRRMGSLKTISGGSKGALPAAEFWEKYDAGEFKK